MPCIGPICYKSWDHELGTCEPEMTGYCLSKRTCAICLSYNIQGIWNDVHDLVLIHEWYFLQSMPYMVMTVSLLNNFYLSCDYFFDKSHNWYAIFEIMFSRWNLRIQANSHLTHFPLCNPYMHLPRLFFQSRVWIPCVHKRMSCLPSDWFFDFVI